MKHPPKQSKGFDILEKIAEEKDLKQAKKDKKTNVIIYIIFKKYKYNIF